MNHAAPSNIRDRAAIVGIGHTRYTKVSGVTEHRQAVDAIQAALDDAGLTVRDGMNHRGSYQNPRTSGTRIAAARHRRRITAPVGSVFELVTRTSSASGTWHVDVPRI